MREVLHHDSFLLRSDRPVAALLHQVQPALTIFELTSVRRSLVTREAGFVDEVGVAQLAHKRATEDRLIRKDAQLVAVDFGSGDIL
jgi:hypothetical protein